MKLRIPPDQVDGVLTAVRGSKETRVPGGTVELAVDQLRITRGDRHVEVCELRIELTRGQPLIVLDVAHHWAQRFGLWIEASTDANRRVILGTGPEEPPVWRAPAAELREQMSVDAAVREMIRVCLIQILGNTSAIAAGLGGHEHAHQARVGIRKLRTVLAEFGSWCPTIEPTWRADLAAIFEVLGKARDRDVVIAGWLRVLEREGAPKVTLPPPTADDSSAVLRSIAFTQLMLSLRAYAQGAPDASRDDPKLVDAVRRSLTTLRRRSVRHADGFRRRSVDEQHDIRRRLKRLRYVADLTAPLFGRKAVARYVAALEPAQNALGALNDLSVANAWLTGFTAIDPNAWFAVGWLRARLDTTVKACVKPLRKAERATPYWSR